MKNWIKKIGQNKFQFFFFVGIVCLLLIAIVVSSINTSDPVETPGGNNTIIDTPTPKPDEEDVVTTADEFVSMPLDPTTSYKVVRKFYEKDSCIEDQTKSLIKYQNSYRTSLGTSYALESGEYFDVIAAVSGTVTEVSSNPLFGNYVVISSDDDIKTYYYGLSEVAVEKGTKVLQGVKLGVSGSTTVDQETGIHVYFQISKAGKFLNPEKVIGTKTTEI